MMRIKKDSLMTGRTTSSRAAGKRVLCMKMMLFHGFTLLELMVTMAIICITTLTAIAMYSSQVQASQRIDGINCLLSMSLAEERYRTINTTYGTLAQVWGGVTASPEGYYTLAISGVTATGYTLTATAIGSQATDAANGTSCTTLTMTISSGTITKTPAACWPV